MKGFVKRQVGRCARAYHRLRASGLVWHWLNRRGRARQAQAAPLSPKEAAIVEELRTKGIAIVPVTDLVSGETFAELAAIARARWQGPEAEERYQRRGELMVGGKPRSKDYFLVELWEGPHTLDLANPFIRFSLNERILRIVNAYLGTFASFRGFALQATIPVGEGERRYASQEWHRDPEDKTLVKTFLYLNDVAKENGPFMYLPGSQPGGRWRGLYPQRPPRGSRVADEQTLPLEEVRTCVGAAGTFILADTSGLHRGGYATLGKRLMYTSIYATPASPWPPVYHEGPTRTADWLSSEAAFAIDNNLAQPEPRYYKM